MEPVATLTWGQVSLRLLAVILLVLANAFFVAAEFGLVGARRTRIEAEARRGSHRARLARVVIHRLDHYISGTQFGITLASLGLGWIGETTMATLLAHAFTRLPSPLNVIAIHGVAAAIAFAIITFLHIVLGELAPKALALLFPEATSMWTAGPLIGFSRVFSPFIATLNGAANLVLRMLGLHAPREMERVHRPEEIEMLLTQSYEHGLLAEEPVEMIRGVFDLSETTAAEVMTPRTEVIALPEDATLQEAAETILGEGHSRIPVYHETIDQVVGVVLARDVWRAQREGGDALAPLIRPVPFVPDSKDLEHLLREMQIGKVHLVVVVDEFGGTAGILTIEDLLEEIVGEIADEHETLAHALEELPSGDVRLSGTLPIAELNERYGLGLPETEYTTVAGYVLGRLGRLGRPGDEVRFERGSFRVLTMDGRRVSRLLLRLEPAAPPDDGEQAPP